MNIRSTIFLLMVPITLLFPGCTTKETSVAKRRMPRSVTVMRLDESQPHDVLMMTGSVGAWKTEQIGFEVPGRIQQVLEPETEIDGRLFGRLGKKVIVPGTVLAKINDERYQIAVDLARAAVDVSTRRKEAVEIDLKQGIPARMASAEAEQRFAQGEFARSKKLQAQNAISDAEFQQNQSNLDTSIANVQNITADKHSTQADLRSRVAEIEQSMQQLADAKRDLRATVLYSSFRGQVAQVHVVPGSYVVAGEPVLTVQMMDPVKVELELSAEMSRQFRYGDTIPLHLLGAQGKPTEHQGFVYMTDPTADEQTRTFTVTLLVRNRKVRPPVPKSFTEKSVAYTKEIWRLDLEAIFDNNLLVEEKAIRQDANGAFVWKITNRFIDQPPQGDDQVLQVEKLRITPQDVTIPFLNNWHFVPVQVIQGQTFDPKRNVIAGGLNVTEGMPDDWKGDQILLDRARWLLRPGDVVRAQVSGNGSLPGIYVPIKAIRHQGGKTYVFIVDESQEDNLVAQKVEVRIAGPKASLVDQQAFHRIEPLDGPSFGKGTPLIVEGAHYLIDGEQIRIVERSEGVQ